MAYTVTIEYHGVEKEAEQLAAPICSIFQPNNSYADLPVMTEGYPVGKDDKTYGKSVYATNTKGERGYPDLPDFYKDPSIPFPVPLAQFKLAIVGEDNKVEFSVEDYKEAFYYKEVGAALADQGFTVTVKNA